MSAFGSRGISLRTSALLGASILTLCMTGSGASAQETAYKFDIPQQPLSEALRAYARVAGDQIIFNNDQVSGRTATLHGTYTADEALTKILNGSHLAARRLAPNEVMVGPAPKKSSSDEEPVVHLAEAAPARAAAGVETVVVTSSKIKGDIQTVPIAITALSQEQLTSRQIAGGPDLVKEVPNLTFTKTNFTGYSITIRGIGTQAISVATDPAVAVALNDIPFIRNHFFEQEFYDVNQVEILRGPQGTLYGRNATAGVVNVISAKPTDQFEAMMSADWGNYTNRRYEAMVNLPIDADQLDLRIAGEWTKRDGYTTNENTGNPVDGRDLWSTRVTLGWHPLQSVQAYLVWEHFGESDDRMRTQKQLCHTDPGLGSIQGTHVLDAATYGKTAGGIGLAFTLTSANFSQGCKPASMYSPDSFQVPYGYALPYVTAGYVSGAMTALIDPYQGASNSPNLRVIQTQIDPKYIAKNDTLEFNADFAVTPSLTFTSQTGFNEDFLWSTEDYNRFNTAPDIFIQGNLPPSNSNAPRINSLVTPDGNYRCTDGTLSIGSVCPGFGGDRLPTGEFCDPQLGCSSRLVAQDVSDEHAWQLSQEFRLASNFKGPFNFSVGGNYMHYETVEDYYVFANALTLFTATSGAGFHNYGPWDPGPNPGVLPGNSDNHECLVNGAPLGGGHGYQYNDPDLGAGQPTSTCYYIDPNPLGELNGNGHNYFRSRNPYVLNSYAGFGEAYYNVLPDVKLTGGLRWTSDHKHFIDIPSELLSLGYGYMPTGSVDQAWNQWTGRFAADWTPKLDFTDQTLIYGSFAHGYKAGGANPPGAVYYSYGGLVGTVGQQGVPVHPLTFKPEFIDAYELGTKNTLLDGGLTLNGDVFYYNYTGYQISRIVDRTALNDNFNATVRGAEIEAMYEPIPGLKFNFAGGYEATRVKDGQYSVDLMDRTAGHPGWVLMKPFVTLSSNCIFPDYVLEALLVKYNGYGEGNPDVSACGAAYNDHIDPVTQAFVHYDNNGNLYELTPHQGLDPYPGGTPITFPRTISGYTSVDPLLPHSISYAGFDPATAPNNGEGFAKNLGGNQLPNAPHFTASFSAEYTIPVSEDWAASLHSDFYWQSQSFARIFNDRPYDKIRGYSNVNLALILTSASGWQVMGYLKNVFDTTAITGTFLNSDDSGLTTNVFLTDPRLFGVRVTKNW